MDDDVERQQASTACHARGLRRRSSRDSSTNISPAITSALRATLATVPGMKALMRYSPMPRPEDRQRVRQPGQQAQNNDAIPVIHA